MLLSPWDKPDFSGNLLVCFGAISISQATGFLADRGFYIFSDNLRHKIVRIADYLARTCQAINAIGAILSCIEPPPLGLNSHCTVCDNQPRCRKIAMDHDDLSLLTAMTLKDRKKQNAKGILTISQLSYGYRPRRCKRTQPDAANADKSAKSSHTQTTARHDNKLKALAIKKSQIHIVGVPTLNFSVFQPTST